ncbi:MAG TPA: hypothetical protein DHV48_08510 [Prolixibacteraceae bacterium]|nr:hypothetical protein [Prolixibacteraceae bacterium]
MKTIFIFLLISVFCLGTYAQNAETKSSVSTSISSSFSINKVYPNPVKDFVIVELRSEDSGTMQVSLINILGSEVKKWESSELLQGEQKLKLDLSSIKSGVYFLKIVKSGQVKTQVIKKN